MVSDSERGLTQAEIDAEKKLTDAERTQLYNIFYGNKEIGFNGLYYNYTHKKDEDDTVTEEPIQTAENPVAIFMGGLPGAGKSVATDIFEKEYEGNIITLDIDRFRVYHPDINAMKMEAFKNPTADSDGYSVKTNNFAWAMCCKMRAHLLENKYNIIIDGTARNAKDTLQSANICKESGYDTQLLAYVPTSADIAFNRTQVRFEKMVNKVKEYLSEGASGPMPDIPRAVGRGYFESVIHSIADSAEVLQKSGVFSSINLYEGISETEHKVTPISADDDLKQILQDKIGTFHKELFQQEQAQDESQQLDFISPPTEETEEKETLQTPAAAETAAEKYDNARRQNYTNYVEDGRDIER